MGMVTESVMNANLQPMVMAMVFPMPKIIALIISILIRLTRITMVLAMPVMVI